MSYITFNYFYLKHLGVNSKHLLQQPTEKQTKKCTWWIYI